MSLEERGAYITLLCHLADKGSITEVNILKTIPATIWDTICCKFQQEDGMFFNDRLRKEVEKRKKFTASRRKNLHMGQHKEHHMKAKSTSHMENENENENEDINRDEDIKKIGFSKYVKMTQTEYDKLVYKYGKFHTEKAIFILDNYIPDKKGKPYKDHYRVILRWVMKKAIEEFPISAHQDGKKDEQFNREGIEKFKKLAGGIKCQ